MRRCWTCLVGLIDLTIANMPHIYYIQFVVDKDKLLRKGMLPWDYTANNGSIS